ncbi:MAG TPA: UxaA family hydrolase, partial [Verrucomicrobiae bacterium]|nr:UxaA family hydrolase [Verrucomicrobiae bacterium]
QPGQQVPLYDQPGTFMGFVRPDGRRSGTRNFIVVLGTTSSAGSYARTLAGRFQDVSRGYPNIDGVVAVAHTEGGGLRRPNNLELVLRTLAGFMTHSNVGAIVAADTGYDPVTNQLLQNFMQQNGYSLDKIHHSFLTLRGTLEQQLAEGESLIRRWLEPVNSFRRSAVPLRDLNIGLQCGGSDGFSGVSGNPLAGWIARETIRHGGSANLAETPELIGAEPYILHNVRDLATARGFLHALQRFQEWASWHGHSAAGNPSGGNLYRGLYNIIVKSIGAARKKDPSMRLDQVIAYGQPMTDPGYYFMDSPGNDLESVAGQVAAGCNLILFTTGNGSVTNFPFVPTIKVVTTTGRFNLLRKEMDINAGRYLDGVPMEVLGEESFRHTVEIASGLRSAGEAAGHSQVQFWREWRQTNPDALAGIQRQRRPTGEPLLTAATSKPSTVFHGLRTCFAAFQGPNGPAADQVALILPTSLCSGQVARLIADQLNRDCLSGVSRFVALPHTEGCGVSRGESERLYLRTMAGYLCHPFVRCALLLEHGCEKTHNDEMQSFLREQQIADESFGWASVQLDGGIDSVSKKVALWFQKSLGPDAPLRTADVGLESLRLGIDSDNAIAPGLAAAFAEISNEIVRSGGTVVLPESCQLLQSAEFCPWLGVKNPQATVGYGEHIRRAGLHIMETPTDHSGEITTGLGATGVEVIVRHVSGRTVQA